MMWFQSEGQYAPNPTSDNVSLFVSLRTKTGKNGFLVPMQLSKYNSLYSGYGQPCVPARPSTD